MEGRDTHRFIFGSLQVPAKNGPLHKGGSQSVFNKGIGEFLCSLESSGLTLLKECLQGVSMQLNALIHFPSRSEGER